MPPPPPSEGRAGNICIWLVTVLFFVIILAGGSFLVLYITLPESETSVWFPVIGLVLVGVPWIFWILTCVYRSVALRNLAAGSDQRLPVRAATISPAGNGGNAGATKAANGNAESPVNSPGGGRRVKFGETKMVDSPESGESGEVDGSPGEGEADGDWRVNDSGSSLTSHESERPLAFSMS